MLIDVLVLNFSVVPDVALLISTPDVPATVYASNIPFAVEPVSGLIQSETVFCNDNEIGVVTYSFTPSKNILPRFAELKTGPL